MSTASSTTSVSVTEPVLQFSQRPETHQKVEQDCEKQEVADDQDDERGIHQAVTRSITIFIYRDTGTE